MSMIEFFRLLSFLLVVISVHSLTDMSGNEFLHRSLTGFLFAACLLYGRHVR